jgi:hypothetical protein
MSIGINISIKGDKIGMYLMETSQFFTIAVVSNDFGVGIGPQMQSQPRTTSNLRKESSKKGSENAKTILSHH